MLQYYVCIICVLQKGMVIIMEVEKVPIPSAACIKVSKEGKTAVFETTIIQSTDNKYFYTTPIYVDKKLVNFEQKGLIKELKVELAPFELYLWKNISIVKFVENGKKYLRIKTTTPGVKSEPWKNVPLTAKKKRKASIINDDDDVVEEETVE